MNYKMEVNMKQIIILATICIVCLLPILLTADENEIQMQKGSKTIIIKGDKDLSQLDELKKINIDIEKKYPIDEAPDAPFFGIYPSDLDFPKAQALNYPNNYGVLITGIVPNSPAYQYRLAEDDIIMEINGKKALNLKEFDKLKAVYRAGDAVNLTVFRNGEIKSIDFVFGNKMKPQTMVIEDGKVIKKKILSPGYGGGTWIPMWYQADMEDVNELVNSIGFAKLPEDGVLTQGLGGKGNVGKGWFIGGQIGWYGSEKKTAEIIDDAHTDYTNYMKYNMLIGGASLDKRIPISKTVITSLGFMLGGSSHTVEVMHTNSDYNWPVATDANPNPTTQDVMNGNTYAKMSRGYLVVQPRAELMVRLLSWFGLRGEVGYVYGFAPHNGWKVEHMDSETYELKGSPDTPFQGMTVTVGPWFGF